MFEVFAAFLVRRYRLVRYGRGRILWKRDQGVWRAWEVGPRGELKPKQVYPVDAIVKTNLMVTRPRRHGVITIRHDK